MRKIKYHKLVRDLIPEIIASSGKTCTTAILSDADYLTMLDAKLNEELAEYQESKSMEELADLLEVMRAVAKARGSSMEEVEQIRREKQSSAAGLTKSCCLQKCSRRKNHERVSCGIRLPCGKPLHSLV